MKSATISAVLPTSIHAVKMFSWLRSSYEGNNANIAQQITELGEEASGSGHNDESNLPVAEVAGPCIEHETQLYE